MQGQRGQDFETAARGRHSFRFLGPRPNDRLSHPVKEAAYRAAIHLNPQRGVERLAHFLQAALGIALMRAPQERLRLGGEFATISLTPPVQETGEALGRQAGLVTKILWPTKGHRVSAEKLVHGQIGSSDLFYHRCDLLGSAFPAGRGPVHPPQHSLNMAIWPACSAVFVRSWGIKRYNWTMLFRGEDSSSSWLLIISSTDSFLRARESRSYVELRSGPVSANCNSPKYQTIVMQYTQEVPEAGPGVKQDGRLTQGEDTADNGGLHLALLALESALTREGKSLGDKGPDGFTNLQRFFLSYAFAWCDQYRPELIRTLVLTNPHSYPKYRVNNVVSNMPEFKQAFGCHEGQKMVHQNFCRIW